MWKLLFFCLFASLTFQIPLIWMDCLSCFVPFSPLHYFCVLPKCSCLIFEGFTTSFSWRHLGVWSHLQWVAHAPQLVVFLENLPLQRLMAKHMQNRGSQSRFDWKCHTQAEVFCIWMYSAGIVSSRFISSLYSESSQIFGYGSLFLSSIS